MAQTPEGKVKAKVIRLIKAHGDDAWYCTPATRGMGRSGVPDILMCLKGVFIAIEVKRDAKHKPTKLQEHELWKIQKSGGWACVIHDDNLLDLEGLMSSIRAMAEISRQEGHAKLDAAEKVDAEKRHEPKPDETIN